MRHLLEEEIEDVEHVPLVLPLDRATVAWLLRLSLGNDNYAASLVASMIRSIREDDELFHQTLH
jgi:hypothetical protein